MEPTKPTFEQRIWLAGLLVAILLAPMSSAAWAAPPRDGWLERLTGFVVVQQSATLVYGEAARFDRYLDQLTLVRRSYETGDRATTDVALYRVEPGAAMKLPGAVSFAAADPQAGDDVFTVGFPLDWGPQ